MKTKIMKKSDLKTGMIIETRAGDRALIVKDNCYGVDAIVFNGDSWTELSGFSDDLIWHKETKRDGGEVGNHCASVDIIKVFSPDLPTGFLSRVNNEGFLVPIWERKEEKPILELDGVEYSESTLRSLIKKATE